MDDVIVFVANYALYISVLITIYALLRLDTKNRKQFIVLALFAAIATILLAKLASWAYYNPRPFVVGQFAPLFPHPNNNGFPSDHTLFTSFLAFLVLNYSRKLGIYLLLIAIAIGVARVLAGVNHTIDILAAIFISGVAVASIWFIILKGINRLMSVSASSNAHKK